MDKDLTLEEKVEVTEKPKEAKPKVKTEKPKVTEAIFLGNGIVWDSGRQKRLCKFEAPIRLRDKGWLITQDPHVISELTRLGYKRISKMELGYEKEMQTKLNEAHK